MDLSLSKHLTKEYGMLTVITCIIYLIVGVMGLIELNRQGVAYERKQRRLKRGA